MFITPIFHDFGATLGSLEDTEYLKKEDKQKAAQALKRLDFLLAIAFWLFAVGSLMWGFGYASKIPITAGLLCFVTSALLLWFGSYVRDCKDAMAKHDEWLQSSDEAAILRHLDDFIIQTAKDYRERYSIRGPVGRYCKNRPDIALQAMERHADQGLIVLSQQPPEEIKGFLRIGLVMLAYEIVRKQDESPHETVIDLQADLKTEIGLLSRFEIFGKVSSTREVWKSIYDEASAIYAAEKQYKLGNKAGVEVPA